MEITLNTIIGNSNNKNCPFHITSIKEEGDDYIVKYDLCNNFKYETSIKNFGKREQKLILSIIKLKMGEKIVKADVIEI